MNNMIIPYTCQCGSSMVSCESGITKYGCDSWCPADGMLRYSVKCKDKQITDLQIRLREKEEKLDIWRKAKTALYCFSHSATPGKGSIENARKLYLKLLKIGELKED